jgi:hypothetical protein
MGNLLACCGLDCAACPAYIATKQDDQAGREGVAKRWSTDEFPLKPEDINCDGCRPAGGVILPFCAVCTTRTCCLERDHENCAHCDDYPCDQLEQHFKMIDSPEMRSTLDGIRAQLRL